MALVALAQFAIRLRGLTARRSAGLEPQAVGSDLAADALPRTGIAIFFGGLLGGMLFGAVPGINMLTLGAVILPFTAAMSPTHAIACPISMGHFQRSLV